MSGRGWRRRKGSGKWDGEWERVEEERGKWELTGRVG